MNDFSSTGLGPDVIKAVNALGFTKPTPIQELAIPAILNETRDVLALAQTGTGKTAAFGLPMVELTNSNSKNTQALIVCPTRELCRQITSDFEKFLAFSKSLNVEAVYGGANISNQIRAIKRGTQIVVGTPGRLKDLIQRGVLQLNNIQYVILDEADEMLNMGFKEDIEHILSETPKSRRTFLFSATMPKEVRRIAQNYMNNPLEISISKEEKTAVNIEHSYCLIPNEKRAQVMQRLLDYYTDAYAIIFCRTRRETQQVGDQLVRNGYAADCIHGDLSQSQRDLVMGRFRSKNIRFLVATDVAARGIDVDDITHVFHYQLPDDPEAYVHRSGRTARAGKHGASISLVGKRDVSKLRTLEKLIGKKMNQLMVPGGEDVAKNQMNTLLNRLMEVKLDTKKFDFLDETLESVIGEMEPKEILMRYLAVQTGGGTTSRHQEDLNLQANGRDGRDSRDGRERGKGRRDSSDRGDRGRDWDTSSKASSYTRYHINLGKKDDLNPNRLMGFINEQPDLEGASIGRIEVLKSFTFFEVDSSKEADVLKSLNGQMFQSRSVQVEFAEPPSKGPKKRQTSNTRFKKNSSSSDSKKFKGEKESRKSRKHFSF